MPVEILFFSLLGAHFFLDFAGQGDFLAKAKNHINPIPGTPWRTALLAHSIQHGSAVALLTGSASLGIAETLIHAVTDWAKSNGLISFNEDQLIHVFAKMMWVALLLF